MLRFYPQSNLHFSALDRNSTLREDLGRRIARRQTTKKALKVVLSLVKQSQTPQAPSRKKNTPSIPKLEFMPRDRRTVVSWHQLILKTQEEALAKRDPPIIGRKAVLGSFGRENTENTTVFKQMLENTI